MFKAGVVLMCWGKIDKHLLSLPFRVTITEAYDTIKRPYSSLHQIPCGARDIRTFNLSKRQQEEVINLSRGAGFKVIDERKTRQPHIHIEQLNMKSKGL